MPCLQRACSVASNDSAYMLVCTGGVHAVAVAEARVSGGLAWCGGADARAARAQTTYTARTSRSETRATRSGASGAARAGPAAALCRTAPRAQPAVAAPVGGAELRGDRGEHTDRHAGSVAARRNYRILFWSLRFHGRLFFRALCVDVQRIWQPAGEDQQIRRAPRCLARLTRHMPWRHAPPRYQARPAQHLCWARALGLKLMIAWDADLLGRSAVSQVAVTQPRRVCFAERSRTQSPYAVRRRQDALDRARHAARALGRGGHL